MRVSLKQNGAFGVKRTRFEAKIDKVEMKPSRMSPGKNAVSVFFRGMGGTGIIEFSPTEKELFFEKKVAIIEEPAPVKKRGRKPKKR